MLGTNLARLLLSLSILALCAFHDQANGAVAQLWEGFQSSMLARHESFEPIVAVSSFFVWTRLFHFLDERMPSLAKYRIHGTDNMEAWKAEGSFRREVLQYMVPLYAYDILFPRRAVLLAAPAPSIERVLLEVCLCLVLYDAIFFCSHLMMHRLPALRAIHARHHMMGSQARACDATRVSFAEQIVLVGTAVVSLNIVRAHALSRCLFNVVITYMITEIHAGYDFPWMLHNVVPFGLVGGAKRHEYHHRQGDKYYQQFFTYLDDAHAYLSSRNGN